MTNRTISLNRAFFYGAALFVSSMVIGYVYLLDDMKSKHVISISMITVLMQAAFLWRCAARHNRQAVVDALQQQEQKLAHLEGELAQANTALEQKVMERTHALTTSNNRLQREINERKHVEARIRTDELQSIGLLISGIAHDLNNVLTAINGNVALAKFYITDADKILPRLVNAEKAVLQAQTLTQQLLTFPTEDAPGRALTIVEEVIRNCIELTLQSSHITCKLTTDNAPWPVDINTGQIAQVISNLLINAEQAMPQGGVINVRTEKVTIDATNGASRMPLQPGRYVRISVHDQGPGIPADHLDKIFEPYFTTKQTGNGLGLFTCYSIIKKHHGHLCVTSQQDVGTTFQAYLPALTHVSHSTTSPTPPSNPETIVV